MCTRRKPTRQQHLCKHSEEWSQAGMISAERDFGFSWGEPKYRICFCRLHFEHLKKKKKKKLQAYSARYFHFFKAVLFFWTELQDVWILGESFCQNVSILYECSCSLEQLNLEGWCEPLVWCYVLCLCPEWKRCCGTPIAFHRSLLLRPSIGTDKRAILVEETVVTFSVLH